MIKFKMLLKKIAKHIRQGSLISVLLKMIGIKYNTQGPNRYHGEIAKNYIKKRVRQKKWNIEQSIIKELISREHSCSTLLDVPFGTGRFVDMYLSKKIDVYGLDISQDMIAVAKETLGSSFDKCKITIGTADNLPYKNEFFDVVISCRYFSIISYSMARNVLSELQRVSKSKIILNIRIRKDNFPILRKVIENILKKFGYTPRWIKRINGNIYEHDLINMFHEFGLFVHQKKIIEQDRRTIVLFYILMKK